MNNLPTSSLNALAAPQDFNYLFDSGSSTATPGPESPSTPPATGNPLPSAFVRRSLPESLFGISPSQFACNYGSVGAFRTKCTLPVCMVLKHHKERASVVVLSDEAVVACSFPHCRFVSPCFTHFKSVEDPSRAGVRARYVEYFALVRSMVLAGTLFVPPPMPSSVPSKSSSFPLCSLLFPFLVSLPFSGVVQVFVGARLLVPRRRRLALGLLLWRVDLPLIR